METWRNIWNDPDEQIFTITDWRGEEHVEGVFVSLTHQCDDWQIVGYAPTPAAAAEVLAEFIAEAQKTLAELEAMS